MLSIKDKDYPDKFLFQGVYVHIGQGEDINYPYIDLIWAGESNLPKINQGTRSIELWIDCWSKHVESNTENFCNELYELQCMVLFALDTWPQYLEKYTFPGGKHFGVSVEVKKICSDGQIKPPTTASRFIINLSVKELFKAKTPMPAIK